MTPAPRLTHPAWQKRVRLLAEAMGGGIHEVTDVFEVARRSFGWSADFTRHVLAAGERSAFVAEGTRWRRCKTERSVA